jgi:REP element-mobilizing transposase RayT
VATYFVTFGSRDGFVLSPEARDIVLSAVKHWHGRRIDLDAAVVMPDHVHLILRVSDGSTLGKIGHSMKSYSAKRVNTLLNRAGSLWLEESFDHIIRHEAEWRDKMAYVRDNPVAACLAKKPEDYKWLFLAQP